MERRFLDNTNFFRSQASLISLIVTNEDEGLGDAQVTTAQSVVNTFEKYFHKDKKFIAFNILVKSQKCLEELQHKKNFSVIGHRVAKLATLTGGENIDLCDLDNYGKTLQKISKLIKHRAENSLLLEHSPDPKTLKVKFINHKPISWKIADKKIIFEEELKKDTEIHIFYNYIK